MLINPAKQNERNLSTKTRSIRISPWKNSPILAFGLVNMPIRAAAHFASLKLKDILHFGPLLRCPHFEIVIQATRLVLLLLHPCNGDFSVFLLNPFRSNLETSAVAAFLEIHYCIIFFLYFLDRGRKQTTRSEKKPKQLQTWKNINTFVLIYLLRRLRLFAWVLPYGSPFATLNHRMVSHMAPGSISQSRRFCWCFWVLVPLSEFFEIFVYEISCFCWHICEFLITAYHGARSHSWVAGTEGFGAVKKRPRRKPRVSSGKTRNPSSFLSVPVSCLEFDKFFVVYGQLLLKIMYHIFFVNDWGALWEKIFFKSFPFFIQDIPIDIAAKDLQTICNLLLEQQVGQFWRQWSPVVGRFVCFVFLGGFFRKIHCRILSSSTTPRSWRSSTMPWISIKPTRKTVWWSSTNRRRCFACAPWHGVPVRSRDTRRLSSPHSSVLMAGRWLFICTSYCSFKAIELDWFLLQDMTASAIVIWIFVSLKPVALIVSKSINQSINQSINGHIPYVVHRSANQSINQWILMLLRHSTNQSINQAVEASMNSVVWRPAEIF